MRKVWWCWGSVFIVAAGFLGMAGCNHESTLAEPKGGGILQIVSEPVTDSLERRALPTEFASHAVLLDVAKAGSGLVAVGERGIIVRSDDGGRTWKQGRVPVSDSLTAVQFPTEKQGWAVGHSGVVLHSADGGATWTRQLDGKIAAQLALQSSQALAEKKGPKDAAAAKRVADAQRLVDDGPDKPFLDLSFENDKAGIVVGAYGMIFHTEDGGQTWTSWMDRLDNPKGLHIYSIARAGQTIYLAGEQGTFFRSLDGGNTFTRIETPYKGTYFCVSVTGDGELVLAGMRGNAYRSSDQGKTFQQIPVPIPVNFSAVTPFPDGALLFANQAGQFLISHDQGKTVEVLPVPPMPPTAAMVPFGDGMLMTVGVAGAIPIPLGKPAPALNPGGAQ